MKFRIQPRQLFAALLVMLFASALVQGQGIILPRPCERPIPRCPQPPQVPQQPLKVKSIKFTTKITDQVAVTHVEQVFENDSPFVLEGVYFFPLPDNVSITEFAMWDGSKRLVGEVRSRDEARKIYDNIVRSRRDPALLEYAGKNLFQASIFPIQPNSDKKIELTYSQILTAESGMVGYRYPLGTGWKANGFMPTPRPVDQGQSSPQPRQAPGSISGVIEISSNVAIKGVYSPSHEVSVKRDGERRAKLSFEAGSTGAQPDFQLFYNLSEQDFGVSLLTYREPGKDGYFLLLVSPKAQLDEQNVVAKDVIFVIDTSGSMGEGMGKESKMEKAKAALRYGVNTLDARDRFNIVSFSGEEHLLSSTPLNGDNAGKRQALEFIEKMRPSGGTNINDSLQAAFRLVQPSERARMIVLVTDGQPTVGETNAKRIMENVRQANTNRIRLFTFGVGYDVNTVLLDGLANDNGGAVAYVEPNEDLEVKVSNFFAKINHPVLSGVSIDWAGLPTDMIYPRVMPDLFHGSQLVLVGRYRDGAKNHRISMLGNVNGQGRNFVYEDLSFPEKQSKNDFLPHLWAMRRVGYLLDQIRANGESKELRDEVVELGTRYGIVTPYTSYLVLEPGMNVADNRQFERSETVTVQARSRRGDLQSPPPPPKPVPSSQAMIVPSGQGAVQMSKQKEALKSSDVIADSSNAPNQNTMRKASGKLFYLRDGVWTDSEFKAEDKLPVLVLKFASNEYFDLGGKESKLADCFALGQRVVVVWNGKVYKVEP